MHYYIFGEKADFHLVAERNAWVARRALLDEYDFKPNIACREISREHAWRLYRDVWAHELEMSNSEVDKIANITFEKPGVMAHMSQY